jgi:hypothetical protein
MATINDEITRLVEQEFTKRNIERVVGDRFPRFKTLHNRVRNTNGFVGEGFIGMPLSDAGVRPC